MKETDVRLEVQFSWWRRMFVVSVDKEKLLCAQMVKCGLRRPRLRGNVNVLHGTGLVYSRLCWILGHTRLVVLILSKLVSRSFL